MAYVNVREWSPDQVTEWLRGLDNVILPYINSFLNNEVKGHQLLSLRSDDLEHLGVYTLGHQELILEAVDHLRNFHYELDRENLQLLALRLSCASHSLYKELLSSEDASKVETQTMSDVANIITTIKPLVCWLDRAPFSGQGEYLDRKSKLLQLSLEMATCAHRDRFTEQPVDAIRTGCKALARLADNIIQEISDPMLLQPASLDLATLKKKENELGFSLMPSYHGIHQIAEIKFTSPAHTSSKLEEGDEIVQVNYQTVVGWQRKKVLGLFQESPPDIVLTLKKRPRHTKVYGQIYMKPYRLPSKKRATPYSRWNDNLPSPRPEFLTIPDFEMPLPRLPPVTQPQPLESESSSDSEPPDSPLESQGRVYPLKPRPVLQRRNTITGASPTSKRPHQAIEQYWNELKHQAAYKHSSSTYIETDNYKHDSVYLRDKSASCGHGLELATQRPATYPKKFDKSLLITTSDASDSKADAKKRVNFEDRKLVFEETSTKNESIKKPPELTSIKEVTCSSTSDINSLLKESNFSAINLNNSDSAQQNLEKSISVNSITSLSHTDEQIKYIDDIVDEINDRSQMNAEWKDEIIEELIGSLKKSCVSIPEKLGNTLPLTTQEKNLPDKSLTMLETPKPIEKPPLVLPLAPPRNQFGDVKITKKPPEIPAKPDVSKKPAVPPRSFTTRVTRGRLDKSHSTPAYDTTEDKIADNNRTPDIFISPPEIPESPVSKEPSTEVVENKTQENENTSESSPPLIDSRREIKIEETPRKCSEPDLIKLPVKLSDTPPEPPPRTIYGNFTDTTPCSVNKPKYFEPKTVSTPINKTAPILDFPDVPNKSSYVTEMPKSETKISPTNSVVRNMMNRNKTMKKKNNLIAKRRKVTVKDLTPCDIQGYLYQRLRNKHTQNFHWEKRWFVLLGSCLYGFKTKEALKAECLIFLTGFTVATAHEVKSRLHAFKVYHTGTAFYFSADNSETMISWVELITAATLHSDGTKPPENVLFSETDDSESEKPKAECKEKSETSRKFGSLKKFTSKKISTESTSSSSSHNESTSLDRKYLRFFNNSSSKTPKNQLPVPTPQFRSYRKVVPPNLVITTTPVNTPKRIEVVVTKPTDIPISELETKDEEASSSSSSSSKSKLKPKPINYIHASNPSLCDLNDHRLQSFYQKSRQFTQRTENLAGFVTLEQFMLNRQEEERRQNVLFGLNENIQINPNTIQPDVVYGEVRMPYSGDSRTFDSKRKDSAPKTEHRKQLSDPQSLKTEPKKLTHARTNSDGYTDLYYEKHSIKTDSKTLPKSDRSMFENQSRSLPRSPEIRRDLIAPYEDSQLISDAKLSEPYELQYADKKSLRMQKIGTDRAYELIYCPQKVNEVQFAQNRTLDGQKKLPDVSRKPSKLLTRQHSLNSADKIDSKIFNRGESPEKFWLDSLRRSDKVSDKCTSKIKLKSATQYTPMCLPLTPDQKGKLNPKFAFELNLDDKSNSSKGGKFKALFGKPSDEKKEKTLLGSPRLHRAFFRKQNNSEGDWSSEAPQVVPFSTNLTPPRSGGLTNSSPSSSVVMSPPPDYPGLEYPPVFEPETYSLANPSCSLTLLRKQQQK